jgi:hypothetical protein
MDLGSANGFDQSRVEFAKRPLPWEKWEDPAMESTEDPLASANQTTGNHSYGPAAYLAL